MKGICSEQFGTRFFFLFWGAGEGSKNIEVKMTNYTSCIYHLFDTQFGASESGQFLFL